MPDFDFYANVYLGDRIQEKAFPALAQRAKMTLADYDRKYTLTGDMDSRKLAICAMAEVLREHDRVCRHTATTVGSVTVHYPQQKEPLERQLYRAASVYLDIYRGVC